jgi:hypothetical protein
MTFKIEKVSNLIMILDTSGTVWKTWDQTEFTSRKLKNYIKKIYRYYNGNIELIVKLQ